MSSNKNKTPSKKNGQKNGQKNEPTQARPAAAVQAAGNTNKDTKHNMQKLNKPPAPHTILHNQLAFPSLTDSIEIQESQRTSTRETEEHASSSSHTYMESTYHTPVTTRAKKRVLDTPNENTQSKKQLHRLDESSFESDSDSTDEETRMDQTKETSQYTTRNDSLTTLLITSENENELFFKLAMATPISFRDEVIFRAGQPHKVDISFKNKQIKLIYDNYEQAQEALKITSLLDKPVRLETLSKENTSTFHQQQRQQDESQYARYKKCVIRHVSTLLTEEEIKQELKVQQVTRMKKMDRNTGMLIPLPLAILTYNLDQQIPAKVTIGFLQYATEPYLPKPMRCNNCQRYGHSTKNCRKTTPTCSFCSETHTFENCPNKTDKNNAKCANCKGNHSAAFKGCPTYDVTNRALETRALEGLNYKEALLKVQTITQNSNRPVNITPSNPTQATAAKEDTSIIYKRLDYLKHQNGQLTNFVANLMIVLENTMKVCVDCPKKTEISNQIQSLIADFRQSTLIHYVEDAFNTQPNHNEPEPTQ